jgi:hypothetical protein
MIPIEPNEEVRISRAYNGFIVWFPEADGPAGYSVYQDRDDWARPNQDPQSVCDMLRDISEHYGAWGSKHDPERLHIEVVKKGEVE